MSNPSSLHRDRLERAAKIALEDAAARAVDLEAPPGEGEESSPAAARDAHDDAAPSAKPKGKAKK